MIAALANGVWLGSNLPAWMRFRQALKEPATAQDAVLQRLLRENAECAFGKAHGFGGIRGYDEFRDRVPITDYEALEPWIARIRQGENSVLTTEPVTRLVPTSGSSGARKLIPFTNTLQREFNAAIGPWMVDLCWEHPGVAMGPAYWSISPALRDAPEDSSVPIGFEDDSAYLGGLRQKLVEATFAAPGTLRRITDLTDFRYATLLCLLRCRNLRLISVWHPSFLALLLDALPDWWYELRSDLYRGECSRFPALRFPPNPYALCGVEPTNHAAIWPHLALVSCWGDGQAALARENLRARLPHVAFQDKGLLATEAFVTIPFQGRHPVAVSSHFYEFLDDSGAAHGVHELSSGKTYRVVVTTGGGLWRYPLGDEVVVDGYLEQTPSLRFLGRGNSVSDLCGEKLSETFVTQVLATALAGSPAAFAMLAPEENHYTLFLEGRASPELLNRVEAGLRANPHYAYCRDLGQLGPLQLCVLSLGANERFLQAHLSEGRRLGDIKPQALSSRKDWRPILTAQATSSSSAASSPADSQGSPLPRP